MQLKSLGSFINVINEGKQLGSMLAISADASKVLEKSLNGLSTAQIVAKTSTMGLSKELQLELIELYATDAANYSNVESLAAISASEATATATTGGLSTAFKGLAASIGMTKLVLGGIVIALVAGLAIFNGIKQRTEELRQATEEAANAYKESTSSIEDYTKRYQELHQSLLAAKGNEEETYNIKKQLLDLQTELLKHCIRHIKISVSYRVRLYSEYFRKDVIYKLKNHYYTDYNENFYYFY